MNRRTTVETGVHEMAGGSHGLTAKIEGLSPRGLWLAVTLVSAAGVVAVSVAAGLALQGGGYWVGWRPVGLAVVVAASMPIVGLWPLSRCDTTDSKRIFLAAFSGTPIRLFAAGVLGVLGALSLGGRPERVAFVLWLVGLCLVSLLVETVVLAVWLQGRNGRTRV